MTEAILDVKNLCKKYRDRVILDDVSFRLSPGEILGLMGGSGSGKSTILKLIIGLAKADQGEICFENQDLNLLPEREMAKVRPRIGYVFQEGALFDSLTVEENLSYPLQKHTQLGQDEIRAQINERLEAIGMARTNSLYPSELSGGMRKRVGLLRATMLHPRLVLFDEPTAGLDPIVIKTLVDQIREYRRLYKLSGIFISHDALAILAVCDRVAILWEGKLRIEEASLIRKSEDPIVRSFIRPDYEEVSHGQAS